LCFCVRLSKDRFAAWRFKCAEEVEGENNFVYATLAVVWAAKELISVRRTRAGARDVTEMNRKSFLDAALGLCTVGGAIVAVGASKEPVSKIVVLPDLAFGILMVVGGVLAAVGAIAFMFSFLVDRIERAVSQVAYGDLDSKYVCIEARLSDLAGVHALYTRFFLDDVPSIQLMQMWVSKCGSAFTLVHRVVHEGGLPTRQELVGSFKLLPLTAKGVRAIELGQATGSTFRPEHISGGRGKPAGYWVGDVVATTRFARGVVMAQLNAAVLPRSSRGGDCLRAATYK
jgi:hypothetical protein